MKRLQIGAVLIVPIFAGAIYFATATQPGFSQTPPRPPNAAIGVQALGRVRVHPDQTVELYGYCTFVAGIPGPFFTGDPGENTAVLTFRAEPTGATFVTNGGIVQGIEKPANGQSTTLHIYYTAAPGPRDILNPDDFARGVEVGQFQSQSAVVNVVAPGNFAASSGLTLGTATDFTINGQTVNFGAIANGLSLSLFGPAPAFDSILRQLLADGSVSIQYSATAYIAQ